MPDLSDDFLVQHPAERGPSRQRAVVVYACCSCCCCLHTLGSLAGALYGGGFKRLASDPGFDRERRIPMVHWLFDWLPRTQWIFWTSLVGVVFVVTAGLAVLFGFSGLTGGGPGLTEGLVVSLFGLAMLGPLVPVAAWVVSLDSSGVCDQGPAGVRRVLAAAQDAAVVIRGDRGRPAGDGADPADVHGGGSLNGNRVFQPSAWCGWGAEPTEMTTV
ncbi:MAG: hypothetical protein ACK5EA_14430 [Planctomycetaceae bacterium]